MAAVTSCQTLVRLSRRQALPVLGAGYNGQRDNSTNLASYKRGRGGRSSFSGKVVTVFGASGFLGRYIVNKLGKLGSQIICPYRADPYHMKDLKLAGDLGQVLFLPYNLRDEVSIQRVMKYSNTVINLVGCDWETKMFKYEDVNVEGPRLIAQLARECGVDTFVHFSALNARPGLPSIYIKGGSNFLRTKYHGEQAVRDEFPEAIIMRPADIYGPEDRFIRYYASTSRRGIGGNNLPMWKRGTETVKMPVFCSDVAQGVINAIYDRDAIGKTFELVGPNSYKLSDLVDFFYRCMRYSNFRRSYMSPLFIARTELFSYAPSTPILFADKLDREHQSDIERGLPNLVDLGVKLTRIEDRAPHELKPFKKYAYYLEEVGEYEDPAPPPVLA